MQLIPQLPRGLGLIYILRATTTYKGATLLEQAGAYPAFAGRNDAGGPLHSIFATAPYCRTLPAVTAHEVTLCGLVPYVFACPRQCRSSVRGCPRSRRAFLDVLHIRVVQLITPTAQRVRFNLHFACHHYLQRGNFGGTGRDRTDCPGDCRALRLGCPI